MSGKVVNTKHVASPDDGSLPEGVVYIGRRQHWGKIRTFPASPFTNYFSVKRYGREEALRRFEDKLRSRPDLMARIPELEGKTLACWCAGKEGTPEILTADDDLFCHGQILLRVLREYV